LLYLRVQRNGNKETALDEIEIFCNLAGLDHMVDASIDPLFGSILEP
jgi:hypothetical protein